jgi:hypothetical protein
VNHKPAMAILNLVVFYMLVSIFAGNAASSARWKVFVIGLVATLLLTGVSRSVPTLTGLAVGVGLGAAASVAGLLFWLKLGRKQALQVTSAYVAFVLLISVVFALVFGSAA